jgi:hypothetical protein
VRSAGHEHDVPTRTHVIEQQPHQQVVGQVVDAEGRLETIRRLGWSRDDLDARVADDPGQRRQVGPAERLNEGADRTESIEIERQHLRRAALLP